MSLSLKTVDISYPKLRLKIIDEDQKVFQEILTIF